MALRLKDKVALVSGAGSVGPGWGNGRATTVRFVEEGAKVFAVDRDPAALRETVDKAPGVATHTCDVTDARGVAQMVAACLERYGRISPLAAHHYPLAYLYFPVLVWAAFQFTPRVAFAMIWLLSVTMTAGLESIFHHESRPDRPRIGFLQKAAELNEKLPALNAALASAEAAGTSAVAVRFIPAASTRSTSS